SKDSFQKSSKAIDPQRENRPGRDPGFSASQLCPFFSSISTIPVSLPRNLAYNLPMKLFRIKTGAALRELRESLRLSQPQMAEALEIKLRTYEGWEQGRKDTTGLNLYFIQSGFQFSEPQAKPEPKPKAKPANKTKKGVNHIRRKISAKPQLLCNRR